MNRVVKFWCQIGWLRFTREGITAIRNHFTVSSFALDWNCSRSTQLLHSSTLQQCQSAKMTSLGMIMTGRGEGTKMTSHWKMMSKASMFWQPCYKSHCWFLYYRILITTSSTHFIQFHVWNHHDYSTPALFFHLWGSSPGSQLHHPDRHSSVRCQPSDLRPGGDRTSGVSRIIWNWRGRLRCSQERWTAGTGSSFYCCRNPRESNPATTCHYSMGANISNRVWARACEAG